MLQLMLLLLLRKVVLTADLREQGANSSQNSSNFSISEVVLGLAALAAAVPKSEFVADLPHRHQSPAIGLQSK